MNISQATSNTNVVYKAQPTNHILHRTAYTKHTLTNNEDSSRAVADKIIVVKDKVHKIKHKVHDVAAALKKGSTVLPLQSCTKY